MSLKGNLLLTRLRNDKPPLFSTSFLYLSRALPPPLLHRDLSLKEAGIDADRETILLFTNLSDWDAEKLIFSRRPPQSRCRRSSVRGEENTRAASRRWFRSSPTDCRSPYIQFESTDFGSPLPGSRDHFHCPDRTQTSHCKSGLGKELTGVKTLTFLTDPTKDGKGGDWGLWLEPVLSRSKR